MFKTIIIDVEFLVQYLLTKDYKESVHKTPDVPMLRANT